MDSATLEPLIENITEMKYVPKYECLGEVWKSSFIFSHDVEGPPLLSKIYYGVLIVAVMIRHPRLHFLAFCDETSSKMCTCT